MRMWNVDTSKMCNKHLLGEHLEMHMFVGCIKKGMSIKGYVDKGLVEVSNISKRHNVLVKEMLIRKMNHKTPIDDTSAFPEQGKVDVEENIKELKKRCSKCKF